MTEADWLTGTDFAALAQFAVDHRHLSPRRERLLAVAFCRAVDHLLIDHAELVSALLTVERYADQQASGTDLDRARQRCREIAHESFESYSRQVDRGALTGGGCERQELAWLVAYAAATALTVADVSKRAANAVAQTRTGAALVAPAPSVEELLHLCAIVREVVGNPFRPVEFAPWRTDTAIALARQMYESREFSAMPILADALQDAGCDRDDVLDHCRNTEQLHVRGCWVVDGVLGNE